MADDVFFVPALEGPATGAGGPARALQLDRPQPRHQPGRGQGVPPPLHGRTTPTPRTTRSSTTSRPSSSGCPTSTPGWPEDPFGSNPADKLGLMTFDDVVELDDQHRPPRSGQPGRGRGVRHLRHPNDDGQGGPGRDGPAGRGGGRRGPDQAHLRKLARTGTGRGIGLNARAVAVTVEAVGLTKTFSGGRRPAVDDVNLATEEGEFLVLLGPSGCGKTTLLRMIAGLEQPTGGEVRIGGELVNGLPPRARRIAMVFQSYALYPHKTVRQNIELPAQGREAADRQAAGAGGVGGRAARARPRCSTAGPGSSPAASASGWRWPGPWCGSRACSCSTSRCPTWTPSCGRRPATTSRTSSSGSGTTTIYVTHDQVEAMGMGDRIVVMYEGQVRQVGPPQDGLRAPGRHVRGHLPRLAADEPDPPGRHHRRLPAGEGAAGRGARRGARRPPPVDHGRAAHRVPVRRPAPARQWRPASASRRRRSSGCRPPCSPRSRRAPSTTSSCGTTTCASSTPRRTKADRWPALADREGLLARLMLLPAIVYIVALVAVPFFLAIAYSFSDVTAGDPSFDFVGLRELPGHLGGPGLRPGAVEHLPVHRGDDGADGRPGQHPGDRAHGRLPRASGSCASSCCCPGPRRPRWAPSPGCACSTRCSARSTGSCGRSACWRTAATWCGSASRAWPRRR